jgi:trehalose 6-phosphate synthase/phosphatase
MPQVIIVSNRLPVSVKKEGGELEFFPSVGGLATGLSSYVNDKNSIWIGWPGIASDELNRHDREEIVNELAKHNCLPVFLTKKQIDDFYNGYSNTVLWPLFHKLRPQDQPGERRTRWYNSYRAVNKLFAETVEVVAVDSARIWVHDYQLLQVPEMLRSMKVNAMIGFFLHIPFPDPKKIKTLPRHRKLIKGILGADLIGFHTPDYVENFLDTCKEIKLGLVGDQSLTFDNRIIRISDFPMGIDYEKYTSAGKTSAVKQSVKKYRRLYRGRKAIVAVDRLDPSKGLIERLKAYELFLKQYPRMQGKVIFIMVAAPSRTDVPAYRRLAERLDILVKQINKTYGNSNWQPIDYINRSVPFEEVVALFKIADVAFIAPLRDGMNLAAKEFVASAHRKGVLILSETAGASQELSDALIVNPRQPETVVNALYSSLTMRRSDLKKRLKRMKQYLKINTVHSWARTFVNTLQKPIPSTSLRTRTLSTKYEKRLCEDFQNSRKHLLLLDYDGTLVPFHDDYRRVKPSKNLIKLLTDLNSDPANEVVLISGRSAENLNDWFGHLPINLVAEHGACLKRAGRKKWHIQERQDNAWKKQLLSILEKYVALTPGAKVEVKPHSLVWHYRSASPYHAQKYTVIIRRVLKPLLKIYGLEILKGNKVLEIKNPNINKGKGAQLWLDRNYDFILAIGDDATDEELFAVLPDRAYSVKVGRGRTAAGYRVSSYRDALKLLHKLQ